MTNESDEPGCCLICSTIACVTAWGFLIIALYVAAWAAVIYALVTLGQLWLIENPNAINITSFVILLLTLLRGSHSEYNVSIREKPYQKIQTYYSSRVKSSNREPTPYPTSPLKTEQV